MGARATPLADAGSAASSHNPAAACWLRAAGGRTAGDKGHRSGGDDDVAGGGGAADVDAAGQAVGDAVGAGQLGLAAQDGLRGRCEGRV